MLLQIFFVILSVFEQKETLKGKHSIELKLQWNEHWFLFEHYVSPVSE